MQLGGYRVNLGAPEDTDRAWRRLPVPSHELRRIHSHVAPADGRVERLTERCNPRVADSLRLHRGPAGELVGHVLEVS